MNFRDAVRKLLASHLDLPSSSALVIDDPLSGVPIALVPALGADHENVLVPESAWFADGPGPFPVLADIAQCSVHGGARGSAILPAISVAGGELTMHSCRLEANGGSSLLVTGGVVDVSRSVAPWLNMLARERHSRRRRALLVGRMDIVIDMHVPALLVGTRRLELVGS